MTSSTFDGATAPAHRGDPLAGLDRDEQPAPPVAEDLGPAPSGHVGSHSNGGGEGSALDLLRERVEQRESAPVEMWVKEIPRTGVRITCDPRVPNSEFQRWMRASRPKKQGRGGQVDGMDLDQLGFSCRALAATNIAIEIDKRFGKGGESDWETLRDRDGDNLTVEHQEVWRLFSVHRADVLLTKLFGRDPAVIDAGQEFLAAAGYMGDADDESDPLG